MEERSPENGRRCHREHSGNIICNRAHKEAMKGGKDRE